LSAKWLLIAIVFFNTGVLPTLFAYVLYKKGQLSSMLMEERKERIIPLFIAVLFYFSTWFLLRNTALPPFIDNFLFGISICGLFTLLINFIYKISLHTLAIGGVLGGLFGFGHLFQVDLAWAILPVVLMLGVTASARLWLSSHRPSEVYVGALLGFLTVYGAILLDLG
jgi:hypothetical protein